MNSCGLCQPFYCKCQDHPAGCVLLPGGPAHQCQLCYYLHTEHKQKMHYKGIICFSLVHILCVGGEAFSEQDSDILSEIDDANVEARVLADELEQLLTKVEQEEDSNVFENDELYREIVAKIEDLAEATEEDNLIKLSAVVKDRRNIEEDFQKSLVNLQNLSDKLEKASMSNSKEDEISSILETATK